jgi:hypothetical protein
VLKKTIFMLKNNDIIPITNKSDLYNLVPEKAKELKKMYRTNKLNFKKNAVTASEKMIREIEKMGW